MTEKIILSVVMSLGVFIGNAFLIPLFTQRTFKDGAAIGTIAAIICYILCFLFLS